MARVLLITNIGETIYNCRRELLRRLVKDGHRVGIAVTMSHYDGSFRELGCEVINIPVSRQGLNPLGDLLLFCRYLRLLRTFKPDAVFTYTVKANVYGNLACRLAGIPCVSNITGLGSGYDRGGLLRKLLLGLQRFAYRHTACVFFQNRANMDLFMGMGLVRGRTRLIPGSGVNLELHRLEDYPPEGEALRVLMVSRIRADKGVDEFFRVVEALGQKVDFELVGAVDEDGYGERVRELEERGLLRYHGVVLQERIHELIAESHCMLCPSHHEGMANVLLEAAAAGRPCLASDIPGCREAVEHGRTGLLFEVTNADALLTSLNEFIALPHERRAAMGRAGREKMEREFDRELVVDAYVGELERLLR